MTIKQTPISLGKGELYTIEAFYIELANDGSGEYTEGDRCEDIDEKYTEQINGDLDTYVRHLAFTSNIDSPVIIYAFPRRWAEGVYIEEDGEGYYELEDFGDVCMGQEEYFYNGETLTQDVEEIEEDQYSDDCDAFIATIINELVDKKMLQMMVDIGGKESIGGYITSEMFSRRPDLIDILQSWNKELSLDDVIEEMNRANNGGVTVFMEARGIDW